MYLEIATGLFLIGTFIYHRLTENDFPTVNPGVMALPQTEEGTPIPLIYGHCRVRAPVLAWAGNWYPAPTSTYFVYSVNMQWVVGAPFFGGAATLQSVYVGNTMLVLISGIAGDTHMRAGRYPFTTSSGFDLFGGPGLGGGVVGAIEFFDGNPTQQVSDMLNDAISYTYLEGYQTGDIPASPPSGFQTSSIDATLIPGYRNLATCFLFVWEIGEQPNMLPYSFEVTALSTGSSSDMGQSLSDDADPAAVIYDLLTSPWGKLAIPTSKVDLPSFQAASLTLFNEGHGYSRAIERAEDAKTIIDDILRQIDGAMYEEPTTGKIVLRLVRADYTLPSLTDINPDNATPAGSNWYSVLGWSETYNQVRVVFTNRASAFTDDTVVAQNAANVTNQGGKLRSVDIAYPGCSNVTLAGKLAARELAAVSRPQARASVIVNRAFYMARPGDVFTLTWPELGISAMVMRVGRVDLGQLHENKITLDLIRDIFDVSLGAFPPP